MKSWKSAAKCALAAALSAAVIVTSVPFTGFGIRVNADAASLQTTVDSNLVIQESSIHKQLTVKTGAQVSLPSSVDGVEGSSIEYSVPENPYVTVEGNSLKVVKQPYASAENYTFDLTAKVTDNAGNTVEKKFPMIVRKGLADDDLGGYLYVCFADPASGGDVQQIHFFLSEDGLNWTAVNGCLPAYMVGTDYPTSDYYFYQDWKTDAIPDQQTYDSTPKSAKNGAFYDEGDIEATTSGDASVLFPFEGRDHGLRDPYLLRGSLKDGSDANVIRILATDLNIYGKQYGNVNWGRMTSSTESGDKYAGASGSGGSKQLFVFETTDLIHWERRTVDVATEIEGGCAWAPEAVYNPEKDNYLVYWSCRIKGDGWARNRLYCNETKDFKTFGPTKLYEEEPFYQSYMEKYPNYPQGTSDGSSDGFGNIDTSQLWVADGDNPYGTLYRVVKDETNNHIELMSASTVLDPSKDYDSTNPILKKADVAASNGTSTDTARVAWEYYIDQSVGNHFTKISQANMEKYNGAYEGATMFKFFDRDEWCVMIDNYGDTSKRYEPYTTTNLAQPDSIQKVTAGYGRTKSPGNSVGDVGCHGGMIPITVAEYNKIIDTYNSEDRYIEITGLSEDKIRTTKNQSGYVYHDIEYLQIDKTELTDTIAAAQAAAEDKNKYTADQISKLNALVTKGKSLENNTKATSEEINSFLAEVSAILDAVELNTKAVSVKEGSKVTITSTSTDLTWTSADPSIATVANGVITGVKVGKTTVTAENAKGIKATVEVTVTSAVVLSKNSASIEVGASETITSDSKDLTWTSADTSVATVKNGVITGVKAGKTTVTAKDSKGFSATVEVTVKEKSVTPSIKLSKTSLTLTVGNSKKITATVVPATDKVTWTSKKPSIASVKDGTIKAVKAGSTTITATTSSGKKANIKVTVKAKDSLSITGKTTVKVKKSLTLKAKTTGSLKAANTAWSITKGGKNAELKKKKGASVKLKAKKKGSVTVKAKNGKKSAKITITIK